MHLEIDFCVAIAYRNQNVIYIRQGECVMEEIEALERLARLRDSGALSQEEFEFQKKRIIASPKDDIFTNRRPKNASTVRSFIWFVLMGILVISFIFIVASIGGDENSESKGNFSKPIQSLPSMVAFDRHVCAEESIKIALREIIEEQIRIKPKHYKLEGFASGAVDSNAKSAACSVLIAVEWNDVIAQRRSRPYTLDYTVRQSAEDDNQFVVSIYPDNTVSTLLVLAKESFWPDGGQENSNDAAIEVNSTS